MKNNGFKLFVTVFFLALTGYYLFPSVQYYLLSQKLDGMTEEERTTYEAEHIQEIRQKKENALNLGLDLLGGMHVTLEIRVESLIDELAQDKDDTFREVLAQARQEARENDVSVIDAFIDAFEERDASARLSRYYRNNDAGIDRRSSNEEVAQYLRDEADAAVTRAIEIIRDRVDRYGVTEPSIQRQGSRRVVVELPGVDDAERVRGLLKGTARLQFHLMAEPSELVRSLQQVIAYYEADVVADTAAVDSVDLAIEDDSTFDVNSLLDEEEAGPTNPFLAIFNPVGQGTTFGTVTERDTAAVNRMLADPAVREMLPRGVVLMYDSNPMGTTPDGLEVYELLGVVEEPEMTGEVITDARVDFDQFTNAPEVTMVMNAEGAQTWARITGANIEKQVAIVLDGVVYSDPVVQQQILGGRSSISGLASREEAQDIVTVLKSGALPAPVEIEAERTVGPSLGAASIRDGFRSLIFGLLLVALFMIFYYRLGGVVADLALLINIIFILGILAGFNATLTLPGIAGIVLTIGMAVDANVLIFERIREEQSTGKTLRAAIDGGYAKALSAIFDANITTFFVAAILFSFGVGPIQGFAVTLMAGILASMFSAIVFTRIIFDYLVVDRRMQVNYG